MTNILTCILLAQRIISALGSIYLYEMRFIKNQKRVSLSDENLENKLRCPRLQMEVDLDVLSKCEEQQTSH